jgi:hypothetical protein
MEDKEMKVVILGGGPSGAMAAWACIQYGHDPVVYDENPEKISIGQNHGVFALWDNCDLFLSQSQRVQIGLVGAKGLPKATVEEIYRDKVYGGDVVPDSVSISKYAGSKYKVSYNHAEAYQQIIDIISPGRILQYKYQEPRDLIPLFHGYELVISTIPAPVMWPDMVWPSKDAYIYHSEAPKEDAFMIYNVNSSIPWYRCSAIFSHFTMEYPSLPDSEKKYVKVRKIIDPPQPVIETDNFWSVGRFGGWNKDMLTEDVYWHVLRRLDERKRKQSGQTFISVSASG